MSTHHSTALAALAALALFSCTGEKDTAASDTNDPSSCEITATSDYPTDGQADFFYKAALEFELSEADGSAVVTLADSSGADVAGTSELNEDQDEVVFTPSSALSPSTSYTATITWCDGNKSADVAFTTSELGTALSDPASINGNTYAIGLDSGRFVEPAGIGSTLADLASNKVLLNITAADATSLTFRGAISQETNTDQDTCVPSLDDFPAADFSSQPDFSFLAPDGLSLSVAGFDVSIASLSITGTFAADGSYFGGGELAGELDVRDLAPVLGDLLGSEDPDELCGLVIAAGITCSTCASDGQPYCASILIDQIVAEEVGAEVASITETDCFEGCAASCTNAECEEASTFAVCN